MSAETTFSGIMFIIAIIVCFIIFTRRCKKEAEEESAEMHLLLQFMDNEEERLPFFQK